MLLGFVRRDALGLLGGLEFATRVGVVVLGQPRHARRLMFVHQTGRRLLIQTLQGRDALDRLGLLLLLNQCALRLGVRVVGLSRVVLIRLLGVANLRKERTRALFQVVRRLNQTRALSGSRRGLVRVLSQAQRRRRGLRCDLQILLHL